METLTCNKIKISILDYVLCTMTSQRVLLKHLSIKYDSKDVIKVYFFRFLLILGTHLVKKSYYWISKFKFEFPNWRLDFQNEIDEAPGKRAHSKWYRS